MYIYVYVQIYIYITYADWRIYYPTSPRTCDTTFHASSASLHVRAKAVESRKLSRSFSQ